MAINKIDAIDLHHLRLFVLLMRERSVTRVARIVQRGQPAVSHGLARLRSHFGDELFVRNGRVLEPTSRAVELHRSLGAPLEALETALVASTNFDARIASPTFRIGLSDDLQLAFLPAIVAALRREIPNARLVAVASARARAFELLEGRSVSTVLGNLGTLPASARTRVLRRVQFSVLCARKLRGPLSPDRYCSGRHVLVTSEGDMSGVIDRLLADIGRARRVVVSVPYFTVLPSLLGDDDLMATVPDHVAKSLSTSHALYQYALPFPSPRYELAMAWRASIDNDKGERLLRDVILRTVGGARRWENHAT
jgi:LysR family transcriptional activator of mexEF-oprN operon